MIDDKEVIALLKEHLTEESYKVNTAPNGQEGLIQARKEKPDLIVLDVVMPEMNGLDVLKTLKKENKTKDIPVIMFTSLCGDDNIVDIAKNLGAVECFTKSAMPFEKFFERIKRVLETDE